MTTEQKFKEMAIQYLIDNPESILNVGLFKQHLKDINFPFDADDMLYREGFISRRWEYKVDNIVCNKSMKLPGIIPLRLVEEGSKPCYFFVKEGSTILASVKTIPGVQVLVENEELPSDLFGV